LTLVRRDDGRVKFAVRNDLEDTDEDIAEYGDGSVILCIDDYTIYDGINEYEQIDAPPKQLRDLRRELASALIPITYEYQSWDTDDTYDGTARLNPLA
jgi:hypothetical protein